MSVVSKPNKGHKEPKWCRHCDLSEENYVGHLSRRKYPSNTLIKCDNCGRLWVSKLSISESIFWTERKNIPRKLRWYHWANRYKPKELDA